MTHNLKLSPMAVYKIRKILQSQTKSQDWFEISEPTVEDTSDINYLMQSLYPSEVERVQRIQELEALAGCYQNLFTQSSQRLQDIQTIEEQILKILNPSDSQGTSSQDQQVRDLFAPTHCRSVADALLILNTMLNISSQFLGSKIALRSLENAKPKSQGLMKFTKTEKELTIQGDPAADLSNEDRWALQAWTALYLQYCGSILSDFHLIFLQAYQQASQAR